MSSVDPGEYRLSFFKREGFERKKCRYGGEYFWTLNQNQDHCNDAPCVEYYFWKLPRRRGMSVRDARQAFIRFFEKNGHQPIEPRPVVARWRDDLYLTIASIVVFQPHVTSGIVPPPANPLVIVQPSIRLEDIDHVGVTLGRHLTSFEMGGHHAFNYEDKRIYWKEETVELAYQFFTKELGIPPEHITFKESWWEGGGNAGPSFEVTVGGLELATLVFMQYKITERGYEPIPLKIVDTGYGIERIAWFTQDKPTAFHVIYAELFPWIYKALGVEPAPQKLLWAAARDAGRLDPDNPASLRQFYEKAALDAGVSVKEAREILLREAAVYSILDHTKTLALMLADGIVPSNSGEGYLARLVARRALRLITQLGADISLSEIVERQAKLWGSDYYPQMIETMDYILRVTSLEEERYRRSLERGLREIERVAKRKTVITRDDLITLYDSYGLTPDLVAEAAGKLGLRVEEVPHNFYALVARRHGASGGIGRPREKAILPADVAQWAKGFPATQLLFHQDPYMREFEAKILGVRGVYVVLDKTAFYPTGGGQLHDTGKITVCGIEARVVRVEKMGDVVVHVLDRRLDNCEGQVARGVIDWERRYSLMRHHTSVHVLLGALRRVLGSHIWQAGAEKTPEKARLDVTHYEVPSRSEIARIERLANTVVSSRIPVTVSVIDRNSAEAKYGMRLYQGGVPLSARIRVVKIGDWDVEACFGTHVANTAEIGAIKIVNVEKLQEGVVRFEIVAGSQVAAYARELEQQLEEAAKLIGGSPRELVRRLKRVLDDNATLKKKMKELEREIAQHIAANASSRELCGIKVYAANAGGFTEAAREALRMLTRRGKSIAVIAYKRGGGVAVEIAASRDLQGIVDLRRIRDKLATLGFKGGGKELHVTFYSPKSQDTSIILDSLTTAIQECGD
ncbi:MAG: alanine--tRNA ligase [Hyperthermus sp.]|nr:MAG: alanine--tRNA ligase [Hyperthermus sp.]